MELVTLKPTVYLENRSNTEQQYLTTARSHFFQILHTTNLHILFTSLNSLILSSHRLLEKKNTKKQTVKPRVALPGKKTQRTKCDIQFQTFQSSQDNVDFQRIHVFHS